MKPCSISKEDKMNVEKLREAVKNEVCSRAIDHIIFMEMEP